MIRLQPDPDGPRHLNALAPELVHAMRVACTAVSAPIGRALPLRDPRGSELERGLAVVTRRWVVDVLAPAARFMWQAVGNETARATHTARLTVGRFQDSVEPISPHRDTLDAFVSRARLEGVAVAVSELHDAVEELDAWAACRAAYAAGRPLPGDALDLLTSRYRVSVPPSARRTPAVPAPTTPAGAPIRVERACELAVLALHTSPPNTYGPWARTLSDYLRGGARKRNAIRHLIVQYAPEEGPVANDPLDIIPEQLRHGGGRHE